MRKSVLALGAAVVVLAAAAGGGYVWAQREGQRQLEASAATLRASLGPNGSFTYENPRVSPLSRAADLDRVSLRLANGTLYTADHVRIAGGDAGRISTFTAGNLRGTPPDGRISTAAQLDGSDITLPPPAPAGAPLDLAALRFGRLGFADLRSQVAGGEVLVTRGTVTDYGTGRRSTVALEGVTLPITGQEKADRATMAKLDLSGTDLATMIGAARQGVSPDFSAATPVRYGAEGVAVTRQGAKVFDLARGEMVIDSADAAGSYKGRLGLTGFSFPKPAAAGDNVVMAALPATISGDAALPVVLDAKAGQLELGGWSLRADGVGTLRLSTRLNKIDVAAFRSGNRDPFALLGTEIAALSIAFEDAGLRPAILRVAGQQTGQPEQALIGNIVAMANTAPGLSQIPGAGGSDGAIATFWQRGGTIELQLNPPTPVPAMAIAMGAGNPAQLISHLAPRMTATPAAAPRP